MQKIDMQRIKHVHLIGIGGCGMSAIAKILHEMGYSISGSDLKESSNTIRLKDLGIKIHIGHEESLVRNTDLILVSSAIPLNNPEIIKATANDIPIWSRADMLSWIMDQFPQRITVCGTHGKTTTTSMLALIFVNLKLDPTYLIGGETDPVDGNAKLGKGPYTIAEADESDGSFLKLNPNCTVVTNIENDHLDYFGTIENIKDSFYQFIAKMPEKSFVSICLDNENNKEIIAKMPAHVIFKTYSICDPKADYFADNIKFNNRQSKFDVYASGEKLGEARLIIPGKHNVENALGALAIGINCGIPFSSLVHAIQSFRGARRRFQLLGNTENILVFDDYAHHPSEICATLEAAKGGFKDKRIICVFQPHRFTRTMFLLEEFGKAFTNADEIIITDIYSAGEAPIEGLSGKSVADEIIKNTKNKPVTYIPKKEKVVEYLCDILKEGDIVIFAGAGDIYTAGKELVARLKMSEKDNENITL